MSKYELWGKKEEEPKWEKISEFDGRWEVNSRIDELLESGEYKEATVIKDFRYVLGKEYKGKRKIKVLK